MGQRDEGVTGKGEKAKSQESAQGRQLRAEGRIVGVPNGSRACPNHEVRVLRHGASS